MILNSQISIRITLKLIIVKIIHLDEKLKSNLSHSRSLEPSLTYEHLDKSGTYFVNLLLYVQYH